MSLTKSLLAAASLAVLSAGSAHAGALAASKLNISQLYLSDAMGVPVGATQANPAGINSTISITGESRTGAATADYNGVSSNNGSNNITKTGVGVSVDVLHQLAGPSAGAVAAGVYGGVVENNTSTNVAPPPGYNYALGDMLISGSAIGGSIVGLTRADASAMGPTNIGGSNATILNRAALTSTFTVGANFTGSVAVNADAYLQTFVSLASASEFASASAGYGWNIRISCTQTLTNLCTGWTGNLDFAPDELNQANTSTTDAENFSFSYSGLLISDARTFRAGTSYNLTVNQSSNALVTDEMRTVPEPMTLSLLGVALLAAGAASRKRKVQS